jgi:hypothetical protein
LLKQQVAVVVHNRDGACITLRPGVENVACDPFGKAPLHFPFIIAKA